MNSRNYIQNESQEDYQLIPRIHLSQQQRLQRPQITQFPQVYQFPNQPYAREAASIPPYMPNINSIPQTSQVSNMPYYTDQPNQFQPNLRQEEQEIMQPSFQSQGNNNHYSNMDRDRQLNDQMIKRENRLQTQLSSNYQEIQRQKCKKNQYKKELKSTKERFVQQQIINKQLQNKVKRKANKKLASKTILTNYLIDKCKPQLQREIDMKNELLAENEHLKNQLAKAQNENLKAQQEQITDNGLLTSRLDEIYRLKQELKKMKENLKQKEETINVINDVKQQLKEKNELLELEKAYGDQEIQILEKEKSQRYDELKQNNLRENEGISIMNNQRIIQFDDFQEEPNNNKRSRQEQFEKQKQQIQNYWILKQQRVEQERMLGNEKNQTYKQIVTKAKENNGVLEVCFVIDVTGSMDTYLEQTQKCIREAMQKIKEVTNLETNFSAVCYKDFYDKKRKKDLYSQYDLTKNVQEIKNYLKNIKCGGGDDECEDIEGGLRQMCENISWSKPFKLAILICDCPAHGERFNSGYIDNYPERSTNLEQVLKKIVDQDIMLIGINLTDKTKKMYEEFQKIFKKNGKPDKFMSFEFQMINKVDLWREFVNSIAQVSQSVSLQNQSQSKIRAQQEINGPIEGATEALCKIKNIQNFAEEPGILTETSKFKVYTVNIDDAKFQRHIESIENLKSDQFYSLKEQGTWECIRTKNPIAKGSVKRVFLMKKKNGLRDEIYVIKTPLNGKRYQSKQEAIKECRAHLISQCFMKMYKRDIQQAFEAEGKENIYPNVIYSDILILEEQPDCFWIAERYFNGEFVKYNNNYGYINEENSSPIYPFAMAFSQYTYFKSNFSYIILDIQGVDKYFTDPAILSNLQYDELQEKGFDITDMGQDGIERFQVLFEVRKTICKDLLQTLQIDQ